MIENDTNEKPPLLIASVSDSCGSLTITCEDNKQLMSRYPNKYFDIAIVDPEYGIGESSKNHKSRNTIVKQKRGQLLKCPNPNYKIKQWDNAPAGKEYFNELYRVSKHQIIFGANYFESIMSFPTKPPRRNEYKEFLQNHSSGWIIWDKVNGSNDFNDCEVIFTSFPFKSFVFNYMWAGMMQGKSITEGTTVQGNKKLNEKRIHPTQKPAVIYKWLLEKFAKQGNKILDTHLGSGSIAIACHDYGFELTACELDKEYFDKAMERINNHVAQQKLF